MSHEECRYAPFGAVLCDRISEGSCMRCNSWSKVVLRFDLGNFRARLCRSCAKMLVIQIKGIVR